MDEPIAEVIELKETPGLSTPPDFVVRLEFGPWLSLCVLACGVIIMAGKLADVWGRIKAKRQSVVAQVASEITALKQTHADDIQTLRAQLDADGMNDADREALADMEREANDGNS